MSNYAKVYYDVTNPGSFGGVHRLWKEVGGSKEDVENWLKTQDTYTLHRPARKKFKRNKILVAGLDDQWEADLVDVHGIAKVNNNYKFLLTVIDSLSKYAFVVPIKDKTGDSVVKAFAKIFKTRQPRKLRTDSGKEFLNKSFQAFLKKKNIIFFTSKNETKSAIVERFNRTIMTRLFKYFTATNQKRYVDVLDHVVQSYNTSVHSTTGKAPSDVTVWNAEDVWRKMYDYKVSKKKPKFKAGDLVRISKTKGTFEKGYKTNWTREIFRVVKVYKRGFPEYRLDDLSGEEILGKFMQQELQAVHPDEHQTYKIKRVVKTNKKEALVTWEGYPDTFKTWIKEKDMPQYR